MATKAEVVAAGCPDGVCEALTRVGMDMAKVMAVVKLVLKYIPLVQLDPKEMWNFLVELAGVFFPQPTPSPAPIPKPAP